MAKGKLTARQLEDIQERSRIAWNKMIAREEADYAAVEKAAETRRATFHVVRAA